MNSVDKPTFVSKKLNPGKPTFKFTQNACNKTPYEDHDTEIILSNEILEVCFSREVVVKRISPDKNLLAAAVGCNSLETSFPALSKTDLGHGNAIDDTKRRRERFAFLGLD